MYPIPDVGSERGTLESNIKTNPSSESIRVFYAGLLGGVFLQMLYRLAKECSTSANSIELRFSGINRGSRQEQDRLREIGYLGFLSREELEQERDDADVLLVYMSFEPQDSVFVKTSFPSKLIEYCHKGKPILIWGPKDSNAAQWARKTGAAILVGDPSPRKVTEVLGQIRNDHQLANQVADNATKIALNEFSSDFIQRQFEEALEDAAQTQTHQEPVKST